MRTATFALALTLSTAAATAQDATIVVPEGNFGNYDPTLSAKEAVLANWELAASGLRAGEVLSERIVDLADEGASFASMSRQAGLAQKTLLARYHAAAWIYVAHPDMAGLDEATMQDIVAATATGCEADDCSAEIAQLRAVFARGADELSAASGAARDAITGRQDEIDAVLMSEQLALMAAYLESGAWAEEMVLTEYGMDGTVMADRIIGTIALWRNIEPYVGITSPEIDDAINLASQDLLRTLRRDMRGVERVEPGTPELASLTEAADKLAAELRRASDLFTG